MVLAYPTDHPELICKSLQYNLQVSSNRVCYITIIYYPFLWWPATCFFVQMRSRRLSRCLSLEIPNFWWVLCHHDLRLLLWKQPVADIDLMSQFLILGAWRNSMLVHVLLVIQALTWTSNYWILPLVWFTSNASLHTSPQIFTIIDTLFVAGISWRKLWCR